MRHSLVAATVLTCAIPTVLVASTSTAPAAATCDPFTEPVYAGDVPTVPDVLGVELGVRKLTHGQINTYMAAVDAASPLVSTHELTRTAQGRSLRYAVVGTPADVHAARLAAKLVRDGDLGPKKAAQVAALSPAISLVASNVHGNEPSGADASMALLRDLADRTDCAAAAIRDSQVLVVIPVQNPDGRMLQFRRNSYGFDMNRDWFARTQTETDTKLQLLRDFPPVLAIDAHEMGSNTYFFPPNADPVHHEIPDKAMRWINDLYSPAMQDAFTDRGIPFFNYETYDMFYMGYGDTVPTTGFLSAGMTFEKDGYDGYPRRVREQQLAIWASLSALAGAKEGVLTGWAAAYRQALAEGRKGRLEGNRVWAPGSTLERTVPPQRVRHYFVIPTPGKETEVRALVRRLQRMDVVVRRLTAPLEVPDFRGYARGRRARVLPVGTYWIPMAQPQKHWIQAMMGEDSFVPFPYFYDTTAWSQPLLYNVEAGRSGAVLHPRSVRLGTLPEPDETRSTRGIGRIGLWVLDPESSSAYESEGAMRWIFDHQWRVPYKTVKSKFIGVHALDRVDVLIAPDGYSPDALKLLGRDGRRTLRQWVREGGRLITMRGGTEVAAALGLTTARLSAPTSDIPGALIRAVVRPGPLRAGVSRTVFSFYDYDNVMSFRDPRAVQVRFPRVTGDDWFLSGYQRGARELAGTAVMGAERYGAGQVVTFAGEPHFRAYTVGTEELLWNALTSPRLGVFPRSAGQERVAAATAVSALRPDRGRLAVTVRAVRAGDVVAVLAEAGLTPATRDLGGGLVRVTAAMASAEESPVTPSVVRGLRALGDDVLAVRLPS